MAYDVGYKKPPKAAKWKKGFCPNPKGRGAGNGRSELEIYREILNGDLDYFDGKRWRKAPGSVVLVETYRSAALKGDIDACGAILDLHRHAKKNSDLSPTIIFISESDRGVM